MEKLFQFLFGQNFDYVVSVVNQMDTLQKCIFVFWSMCVVMFYSVFVYLIYLIVKDSIVKLFTSKTI